MTKVLGLRRPVDPVTYPEIMGEDNDGKFLSSMPCVDWNDDRAASIADVFWPATCSANVDENVNGAVLNSYVS